MTWITLPNAARRLGIHKRTLLRWHAAGLIPADVESAISAGLCDPKPGKDGRYRHPPWPPITDEAIRQELLTEARETLCHKDTPAA